MENPLLTIVTIISPESPVEQLRLSITSSLAQTVGSLELLVFIKADEENLSDHTARILEELDNFTIKDDRIRVYTSEHFTYGMFFGAALSEAKGKYVGIVNSTDFIDATFFEKLIRVMNTTGHPVVKGNCIYHNQSGEIIHNDDNYLSIIGEEPYKFLSRPYTALYNKSFLKDNSILWSFNEDPEGLVLLSKVSAYIQILPQVKTAYYHKVFVNSEEDVSKDESLFKSKKQALEFILMNRIHLSKEHVAAVIAEVFLRQIRESIDPIFASKCIQQLLTVIDFFDNRTTRLQNIPVSDALSLLKKEFSQLSIEKIRDRKYLDEFLIWSKTGLNKLIV